ncbi:MAG: hypothetical protein JST26_12180 [Bacteroidetes bacterium]|nr:hypothetical protein [Bacteroidota bacterium]
MFGFFKKKNKPKESEVQQPQASKYHFKWYDIGPENPFNKRLLDCRSLTESMLSATSDESIARSFAHQRHSIGEEFVGFEFNRKASLPVHLVYPHNGSKIEGAAYKAKSMEDKWDIYAWNNIFYFVRSWTGKIEYKAFFAASENTFLIDKIEYDSAEHANEDSTIIENNVHFLLMTLAFGRIYPHKVPKTITGDENIALYSFALFGRNCWYATYEDITDTTITTRPQNT